MWWKEVLETLGIMIFALLVMGLSGLLFMEVVDLLVKFIMWLGPDPFGFIFLGGLI